MPTLTHRRAKEAPARAAAAHDNDTITEDAKGKKAKSLCQSGYLSAFLFLGVCSFLVFTYGRSGEQISTEMVDPTSQKATQPVVENNQNDDVCSNILLYLDDAYAGNGIGCQLNCYVLASIIATYTNRKLVVLSKNRFKELGGSQFGCPSGNSEDDASLFPLGLSRLIKSPEWLTGDCNISCTGVPEYDHRNRGVSFDNITCTKEDGQNVSVLTLDGSEARHFGVDEFYSSKRPSNKSWAFYSEWYSRIGATPNDLKWLSAEGPIQWSKKDLWDQIVSLLNRGGMITLQPWIERDARYKVMEVGLPKKYIALHIRRGDKIKTESKRFVVDYWKKLGYNETTQPTNYIPFSYYMQQLKPEDSQHIKTVYVATDDPATVKEEIANLTNTTHGFTFVMNPDDASSTGHVQQGRDCMDRYNRTVAAITDLLILSQADIFVGEFSSNWGRLLRLWRTSLVNDTMGTGAPRDMRSAFGNWQPPGF